VVQVVVVVVRQLELQIHRVLSVVMEVLAVVVEVVVVLLRVRVLEVMGEMVEEVRLGFILGNNKK
jgi:hypothetical protein